MEEQIILDRVKGKYPDAIVEAAGEDCSFQLYIITDAFDGQSLLQRQKDVLGLFKEELSTGALHALSVTAKTKAEQDQAMAAQSPHVLLSEIK